MYFSPFIVHTSMYFSPFMSLNLYIHVLFMSSDVCILVLFMSSILYLHALPSMFFSPFCYRPLGAISFSAAGLSGTCEIAVDKL